MDNNQINNGMYSSMKPEKHSKAKAIVSLALGIHCLLFSVFSVFWTLYIYVLRHASWLLYRSILRLYTFSYRQLANTYFVASIIYLIMELALGIVSLCLGVSYTARYGKNKFATAGKILSIVGVSLGIVIFILTFIIFIF